MKKKLVASLLVMSMAFGMVACGNSKADDKKSEDGKTAISVVAAQYGQNTSDWWDNFVKDFNKDNPDIDLSVEVVSWNDISSVIDTRISGGKEPDILNIDVFADYQADDLLLPIQDVVSEETYNKMYPAFLEQSEIDGTVWAIPDLASARAMYYNKDILDAAGVEVPTTWDEFEEVLQKLSDAGIQPLTTGGSDKWGATRLINAYAVRTAGNDIMTKAADGEVPYTDEKLVAAADKIAEWAEKGYFGEGITTVDMNTAGSMLMSGKAAIFYNGSWFTQNLTDDAQNPAGEDGIGFFNIPVADESISSATSYSMNCGNILALDNDKYDEATGWFLKYFMENIGNVAMEDQGTVKGYTYDVAADDMDNYTKLVLDEIDKSTEGFAWWEAKMPSEISKTAQENVQPLLNGEMTGEEYMQSIQDVYDMQ